MQTPDNASTPGIIKERLIEFISKADLTNNGLDMKDRTLLKRGLPVVQQLAVDKQNYKFVIFRGSDFVIHLKRMRSEELRGSMLWNTLRQFGVDHTRLRVDGRVTAVWTVPVDDRNRTKLDPDYLDDSVDEDETPEINSVEEPPEEKPADITPHEEKGFEFKTDF